MNSWMQPQNNNMVMGQAQFAPYNNTNVSYSYNRLPVYRADPIHGENAAWQFPMGPNSEIYLPDADEDIMWWIRTDAQGNKNVQAFDVTLHEKVKPVDINDILARLGAVEEWINGKQNKSNAKRNVNNSQSSSATVIAESVN